MQLKGKALLHDIEQAVDPIDRFTLSRSFEDYTSDPMLRSAVLKARAPRVATKMLDGRSCR